MFHQFKYIRQINWIKTVHSIEFTNISVCGGSGCINKHTDEEFRGHVDRLESRYTPLSTQKHSLPHTHDSDSTSTSHHVLVMLHVPWGRRFVESYWLYWLWAELQTSWWSVTDRCQELLLIDRDGITDMSCAVLNADHSSCVVEGSTHGWEINYHQSS